MTASLYFAMLILRYGPLNWQFPTGLWIFAVVLAFLVPDIVRVKKYKDEIEK